MDRITFKTTVFFSILSGLVLGFNLLTGAQGPQPRADHQSHQGHQQHSQKRDKSAAGQSGSAGAASGMDHYLKGHAKGAAGKKTSAAGVELKAELVDPEAKAAKGDAQVSVTLAGFQLVDAAEAKEQPQDGQGHLHYQVDNGPMIASTEPKLTLHALSRGRHTVKVILVGNDHQPIGVEQTLTVTIP